MLMADRKLLAVVPLFFQILITTAGCKPKDLPGTEKLELAKSTSTEAAPLAKDYPGHVVAYSAARGLLLDGASVLPAVLSPEVGFPPSAKPNGEHGLMLAPLLNAMTSSNDAGAAGGAGVKSGERVLVAFEGATPYRAVVEVLFTLGQTAAVSRFDLLMQNEAGERRVVPLNVPKSGDVTCLKVTAAKMEKSLGDLMQSSDAGAPPAAPTAPTPLASRDAICASFLVQNLGVMVKSSGDALDATCTEFAPSQHKDPSIAATKIGPINTPALQKCVTTLATKYPSVKKTPATVSAPREMKWSNIVPVLDVLREAGIEPGLGLAM
jgi:hypothetical protein